MITKEFYKTREDGVNLYKTYSDTDHLIRNKKTGAIYGDAIDVSENEEYEEVAEEYIEFEGPESYDELIEVTKSIEVINKKINHIILTDNEALTVKSLYPTWESKIGKTIEVGFKVSYNGELWRARQTHTALEIYPPSLDTASLYEIIEEQHEGTIDDPIPYAVPMEIFNGKYYTQYDILYQCTRDSGTALSHDLKDLVGHYVIVVTQ